MEKNKEEEYEALEESYRKVDESFNQFLFLLFIPNSWSNLVEVYIDEGEFRMTLNIDDFLNKINAICGYEEMIRLKQACNNLGIPFFYDRQNKTLVELREQPKQERMCVATIRKLASQEAPTSMSSDNIFNGVRSQYNDLIENIMGVNQSK